MLDNSGEHALFAAIDSALISLHNRASLLFHEEKNVNLSLQLKTLSAFKRRCVQQVELKLTRLKELSVDLFPIQEEQLRLEDLEIQSELHGDETLFYKEHGRRMISLNNTTGIASIAIQSLLIEVFEDFLRFAFTRLKSALPKSRRIDISEIIAETDTIPPQPAAELRWLYSQIVIPDILTTSLSNIEWKSSGSGHNTRYSLHGSSRFLDAVSQRKYFIRLFGDDSFETLDRMKSGLLDSLAVEADPQKRLKLFKLAARVGITTASQYLILFRLSKSISCSETWLTS